MRAKMAVYFIADNENPKYDVLRVKIGISGNIERRVKELQTGSPVKLKLMGWIESEDARALERNLHKKYCAKHTHLEWFELSSSDVLEELKWHSTNSYIVTNDDVFKVISFDRKGIPEYIESWQWADCDDSEFCPNCGWGGGLTFNENYCGDYCIECGFAPAFLSNND